VKDVRAMQKEEGKDLSNDLPGGGGGPICGGGGCTVPGGGGRDLSGGSAKSGGGTLRCGGRGTDNGTEMMLVTDGTGCCCCCGGLQRNNTDTGLYREQKRAETHPFNGPLSTTTRISRYQKGKTNLDSTEARDSEWQWHQMRHMQVCTSLQTDNHASTPPLSFFTRRMPFLTPNQQHQSTEGNKSVQKIIINNTM